MHLKAAISMSSAESERRLCEKLYHNLGSTIIDCLNDKKIHEIMLNPDGQLWVDNHEEGLLPITRLSSNIAQVRSNVYDSPTGKYLLIPQGSRLTGQYDSQITYGQRRILIIWKRIIFPNGESIDLQSMPGMDRQGYAGFKGNVIYVFLAQLS